jgi:hypothetical protein
MPTDIMSRYIVEDFPSRSGIDFRDIQEAISSREDVWGLPPHLLRELIYS